MDPQDEDSLRGVNDIDAARLALRGALATIRDLQDANVRLKGNLQEAVSKEKLAATQNVELRRQVGQWQEEAKKWADERAEEAARQRRYEDSTRLKVREEERKGVAEERARMEDNLVRLTEAVEQLRRSNGEKEAKFVELKRLLDTRDAELIGSQREKVELMNRFHMDQESIGRLRVKRDEEIQAMLRSKDTELDNKDRQLRELGRKNEEFQRVLAAGAKEMELKLQEREEYLSKQFREKERALQERYAQREMDLQGSWAELENGLWQKTKDAREKLDRAVHEQFEEKARNLADRQKEIDVLLETRRIDLEEDFKRRLSEGEKRLAEKERMIIERYQGLEVELLKRFEGEVSREKDLVLSQGREQARSLEEEYRDKLAHTARREADVERDLERRRQELDRQSSEREAQLQLSLASKEKGFEEASQHKLVALQEDFLKKENELREGWTHRKVQLLADHETAIEQEKRALSAELDQKSRALEQEYQARVAELERSHRTMEEQFRVWRDGVHSEFLQKEKGLDKQWFTREQELVRKYEVALEQERRVAMLEVQKTKDHFETMRERLEQDLFSRENAAKLAYEKLERELKEAWQRREDEQHKRHEVELDEVRDRHTLVLAQQAKHFENEAMRREEETRRHIGELKERHQAERLGYEKQLADRELEKKGLQDKLAKLETEHQALWEDLWARERKLEAERVSLETQLKDRENQRETKYLSLERELQGIWSKKEQ